MGTTGRRRRPSLGRISFDKLKVCLKELRESRRWMRLVQRSKLIARPKLLDDLLAESEELIRIFVKSLQTASKIKEGENLGR